MMKRPLNFLDSALVQFDQALRTCVPGSTLSQRPSPASSVEQSELSETERHHAAGLMRINHTGEV
ncbi:MAG: demethoxyubiquinone hydroxylase family protein, partial [Pseudohongiellaceae bacterium]